MPELIKSAGEQREQELKQLSGRANTKLQLTTQYAGALIAKPNVLDFKTPLIAPKVVAEYALDLAEAILSGWETDLEERQNALSSLD